MKTRLLTAVLMSAALIAGIGNRSAAKAGKTSKVTDGVFIDYGTSQLFTKDDFDKAIQLLNAEFSGWEGCEMHNIRFTGDTCSNEENLNWVNSLKEGRNYTQCMILDSDFHSPLEERGAWEADKEYENWNWVFARADGGDWELLNWGY